MYCTQQVTQVTYSKWRQLNSLFSGQTAAESTPQSVSPSCCGQLLYSGLMIQCVMTDDHWDLIWCISIHSQVILYACLEKQIFFLCWKKFSFFSVFNCLSPSQRYPYLKHGSLQCDTWLRTLWQPCGHHLTSFRFHLCILIPLASKHM